MSGFELNKLAGSILLAGVIAMLVGNITDILYSPNLNISERGYQVEVSNEPNSATQEKEIVEINIAEIMQDADSVRGEAIFKKKCVTCHLAAKDGAHRVGPNLWQVFGSKQAAKENYSYSKALSAKGENWTEESLYHFLKSPKKYVKGTKMSFVGLKKDADIAGIIAYLKTKQ